MRKDIVIAIVAVVVVALLAFGLSRVTGEKPANSSRPAAEGGDAEKGSGKAIMHVNGEAVTEAEFVAFMQSVPEAQRQFYANPAGRRALAEEIVRVKLLQQQAKKMGLDKDPEITSRVEMVRAQIIASKALEKLVVPEVDKAIQAEYDREKASSKTLHHILIAYEGGAAPAKGGGKAPGAEQAMQKANALAARVRGGEDFAMVARAESDDERSAAEGGSLGPTRPDMLPPEIAQVVQKLEPGRVSDPVRSQFGIHIFKVTVPTIEELRPLLAQQVQQKIMMETVEKLQKQATIKLDPEFFPEVPEQPQGQPQGQPAPAGQAPRPRSNG